MKFNQPDYQTYVKFQHLIIKSCKNENISEEWKFLESLYEHDFKFCTLKSQLKLLLSFLNSIQSDSETTLELKQLPHHKRFIVS